MDLHKEIIKQVEYVPQRHALSILGKFQDPCRLSLNQPDLIYRCWPCFELEVGSETSRGSFQPELSYDSKIPNHSIKKNKLDVKVARVLFH